jgi:hypothetical protein
MVGFTLVSHSYYYLRRRSPGPPFPPDHRLQAGERGATKNSRETFARHPARESQSDGRFILSAQLEST